MSVLISCKDGIVAHARPYSVRSVCHTFSNALLKTGQMFNLLSTDCFRPQRKKSLAFSHSSFLQTITVMLLFTLALKLSKVLKHLCPTKLSTVLEHLCPSKLSSLGASLLYQTVNQKGAHLAFQSVRQFIPPTLPWPQQRTQSVSPTPP